MLVAESVTIHVRVFPPQVAEGFSDDAQTSSRMKEILREALQKMPPTGMSPHPQQQRQGAMRQQGGADQYLGQQYQQFQVWQWDFRLPA